MVFAKDTNYQIGRVWRLWPHFARPAGFRKRLFFSGVGVRYGLTLPEILAFCLSACPVLFTCSPVPVLSGPVLLRSPVSRCLFTCCAAAVSSKTQKLPLYRLRDRGQPLTACFPVQILCNALNHCNSSSVSSSALSKKFLKKSSSVCCFEHKLNYI